MEVVEDQEVDLQDLERVRDIESMFIICHNS